jgi:hypothetical protein
MLELDTFEVLTPGIHILMLERYCVDIICLHQRMLGSVYAMHIELLLEKCVDSDVERKCGSTRTRGAELVV